MFYHCFWFREDDNDVHILSSKLSLQREEMTNIAS